MQNNLSIFNFQDNQVRTLTIEDNETLFCLLDVCKILAITNSRNIVSRLNPHGVHKIDVTDKLGRLQRTTFINESNVYKVIFKSNKPDALKFEEWVTSEVLPSIRKTGSYSVNKEEPEYLEFGSLEYPMNWIYEHSNIIDVYSRSTLKTLDFMEKEIKNMKDNIKQISRISLEFKKNSGEYRFNSRLIKYDRYKQFSFD